MDLESAHSEKVSADTVDEHTRNDLLVLASVLREDSVSFAKHTDELEACLAPHKLRAVLGQLWARNEELFRKRTQIMQDFFRKHENLAPQFHNSSGTSTGSWAAKKRRLLEFIQENNESELEDGLLKRLEKKRRLRACVAGSSGHGPELCDLPDALLCQIYSLVPDKVCAHMSVSKRFLRFLPRADLVVLDIRKTKGQEVTPESLKRFQSGVWLLGASCWGLVGSVTDALATGWCALESLDLSDNQVGDGGVTTLAAALRGCTRLTSLSLSENSICAEGATALGEAIPHFPKLSKLILQGNRIGAAGAQQLFHVTPAPRLSSLSLSGGFIGEAGAKAVAHALLPCPRLTALDLSACDLQPAGIAAILPLLLANTHLEVLALSRNEIEGSGATELAPALAACVRLTELNLNFNDIGADGAAALGPALLRGGGLMHLKLFGNAIGAEGARALLPVLQELTSLTALYLSLNNIEGCMKSQMSGSLRWRLRTFHI